MSLKVELTVLREDWKNLQEKLNEVISEFFSENMPSNAEIYEYDTLYGKAQKIVSWYSDIYQRTRRILTDEKLKIREDVLPNYLSLPAKSKLYAGKYRRYVVKWELDFFFSLMRKECSKALTLIDELTSEISLAPPEEEELKMLEKEIREQIEPSLPLYSSELLQSIKSFRKGVFLASTLICGRMITVIVDKCKSEMKKKRKEEIEWEEVVSFLREKGIADEKELKRILEAIRLYRNKFAHEIGTYPSIEEAILMISGTTLLVRKIAENKDKFHFLF